jgi:DNA-binding MarR family transcriptional regulator
MGDSDEFSRPDHPATLERSAPPGRGEPPRLGDVGWALKNLQWHQRRLADQQLATAGVSYAQWDVLRHLHHRPDASLHALAEATFQADQSMGALAKRMVARGLLERVDGPGRAVHHQLTDAGTRAYSAGAEIMQRVLETSLGRLSGSELTTLQRLLEKAVGTSA